MCKRYFSHKKEWNIITRVCIPIQSTLGWDVLYLSWYIPGKLKGDCVNLTTVSKEISEEFKRLPAEKVAELKEKAKQLQHAKTYVPKQVEHAQQQDATQVATRFQEAVSAKICTLYYKPAIMYSSSIPSIATLDTMVFAWLSVETVP